MSLRRHAPEIAWVAFAAANVAAMLAFFYQATVPFHFVWISLMIVYGNRVWSPRFTWTVLGLVCVATATPLVLAARESGDWIELTEVPLMAAMFVVMVSYATRREAAVVEARQAAEREREFLRNAAHELRAPIAVARGHAELIREATTCALIDEDAAIVVDELDNLGRVSERLLILAAAERERFLHIADVDLEELLVRAVRRWSVVAGRSWTVNADVEGVLRADAHRIQSALDAIIENALLATGDGDRIELSARQEGPTAVIEIRDGGHGIAPEDLPHLFDPFFSPVRKGRGGRRGTGLGLPIVKTIVEAHGGTVTARSAPGGGTVLELRLPGCRDLQDPVSGGPLRTVSPSVETAC